MSVSCDELIPEMLRRLSLLAMLCAAALIGGGCHAAHFADGLRKAHQETGLSSELRETLAGLNWQFDREWSPLAEWDAQSGETRSGSPTPDVGEPAFVWHWTSNPEFSPDDTHIAALEKLAEDDSPTGWNAAVVWTRAQPTALGRTRSVLIKLATFCDPETNEPNERGKSERLIPPPGLRAAAAETLCRTLATSAMSPELALAPIGKLLQSPDLSDVVRAELMRCTAYWIPPHLTIPGVEEALSQPYGHRADFSVVIRRAAVEACLLQALWQSGHTRASNWPVDRSSESASSSKSVAIWNCRFDADPEVRRIFGQWLAVTGSPQALEILVDQLNDSHPLVHESAIQSLSRLGSEAAHQELTKQARSTNARRRSLALQGLSRWGVTGLLPLLHDPEPVVRITLAHSLAGYPSAETSNALRQLLTDDNIQVQRAVVESVASWPKQLAVPLLLHGLRDSAAITRQACFLQLQRHGRFDDPSIVSSSRPEREQAVVKFAEQHGWPLGPIIDISSRATPAPATVPESSATEISRILAHMSQMRQGSPEFSAAVADILRLVESPPEQPHQSHPSPDVPTNIVPASNHETAESALASLTQQRSRLAGQTSTTPFLETFSRQLPALQADLLRKHVLPETSLAYRALIDLQSQDVNVRRQGARRLATHGESSTLSPAVIEQLLPILQREQDQQVWQYVMRAVEPDASPHVAKVARLAVGHTWPDIRVLGCRYVGRHEQPDQALWLAPLLNDANAGVRHEAIVAVGKCHNLLLLNDRVSDDGSVTQPGLRTILLQADQRTRFAIIVSMSRLGDSQGMQELIRLSLHDDSRIRIDAVSAMGTTGQSRFVEHLIRLSWTEADVPVKRAILTSLNQLIPETARPIGLAEQLNYEDKIKLWVAWWSQQRPLSSPQEQTRSLKASHDNI